MLSVEQRKDSIHLPELLLYLKLLHQLLDKSMEVSPSIPMTAAIVEIINCYSKDQCLLEVGRDEESESHFSCSLCAALQERSPAASMTNGNHSRVAVWYSASLWTRSQSTVMPPGLSPAPEHRIPRVLCFA